MYIKYLKLPTGCISPNRFCRSDGHLRLEKELQVLQLALEMLNFFLFGFLWLQVFLIPFSLLPVSAFIVVSIESSIYLNVSIAGSDSMLCCSGRWNQPGI
ncbi:hypothetical protein QYE76_034070 [Lolium multiflorum]|uniref:Transmembrane protein n=1 Tax=Lolium multiflorum TaxID=4521 RepID=A0AAD8VJW0_LOLMU|nr:hypothetical protein QYE76_034070 [Lolium multiflorum]